MSTNSTLAATHTNSALVSNGAVAASSVTSSALRTNSALVSNGAVAASSVSSISSSATSTTSKGAAVGLVANPVSWKYGVAILVSTIGSFILGSEF